MSIRNISTSFDGNNKGMDNSFPDGDNEVTGSPFTIGTSAVSIQLDGNQPNEVVGQVVGDSGEGCYMTFSSLRDADENQDIKFSVDTILSIPNKGSLLKVKGTHSSVKLKLFYSKET